MQPRRPQRQGAPRNEQGYGEGNANAAHAEAGDPPHGRVRNWLSFAAPRRRVLRPLQRLVDQIEGTQPVTGFAYGRM